MATAGTSARASATPPGFRARRSSSASSTIPTTQYDPIFGPHNSIRIPSFYQLDARLERSFVYRRVKLNVFLDVQNITDRQNPEEIIYNYNFTVRSYITGFPTLAVLGARVEF